MENGRILDENRGEIVYSNLMGKVLYSFLYKSGI